MRIAITGASGLVGTNLVNHLTQNGHTVIRITRSKRTSSDTLSWSPEQNRLDASSLEGLDIVIHLAGENIGEGRWTPEKKSEIINSRIQGTSLLSSTLAGLQKPPRALLSASAIGIYGNRLPTEILYEESTPGDGFLSSVVTNWESATDQAQQAGIRVIHMRFGIILSSKGGALTKMLPAFRFGLGGKLGAGHQMMSWIANDEIPFIIDHLIKNESISGPVNIVSPHPTSNLEFTYALGRILHRPTLFSVPHFAIQLLFGEMGRALLLEGNRVTPKKLHESGYSFIHPTLEDALASML